MNYVSSALEVQNSYRERNSLMRTSQHVSTPSCWMHLYAARSPLYHQNAIRFPILNYDIAHLSDEPVQF